MCRKSVGGATPSQREAKMKRVDQLYYDEDNRELLLELEDHTEAVLDLTFLFPSDDESLELLIESE